VNRHRFAGELSNVCGALTRRGGLLCALVKEDPIHWTDEDHPFSPDESGEWCAWERRSGGVCGYGPGSSEHVRDVEPPTVPNLSADPVTAEVRTDGWPVMDAPPDETAVLDLGPGGPWSVRPETAEALRNGAGEVPSDPRTVAAEALRGGDVVVTGPWPVRQYYTTGGSPEWFLEVIDTLEALNRLGEVYAVETWWADPRTRLTRVTWGALLGLPNDEVVRRVSTWAE
jgi:hypothetical protein